jgi:hypothetical protein
LDALPQAGNTASISLMVDILKVIKHSISKTQFKNFLINTNFYFTGEQVERSPSPWLVPVHAPCQVR